MVNIWFTSDLHLSHGNIIKFQDRPWKNIWDMDEALIQRWNSVVNQDDEVYCLGDVSFGSPKRTAELIYALNGKIYLIKGNHEQVILRSHQCQQRFEWIKDYYELKVPDGDANRKVQLICMFHYPITSWNKMHHQSWHLFGHVHNSLPDNPNLKRMDVGVDANDYYPISYDQVKQKLAKRQFRPVDHHK